MAISSPLQSKVPTGSKRTIKKLQGILFNRTKVKKEIFQRQTILQSRREENERRKQREDELEAPNLVRTVRGPSQLISGSAQGFFDRLIGFLGYLTAGWIVNNLPTWIAMGKEFIARTQQMGRILGGFITNSTDIFKDFTRLLGAALTNLMTFDFLDTSGRVSTAFDELNLSVENWGTGFEDVIKLITSPLTEGVASGEDAPSTGTQITDEGAYKDSAPYRGSGDGIERISKIIAQGETGGRYTAYAGDRGKGNQEITTMTLTQLRQKYGDYNTAVGAYQFMPGTAIGLAKQLGMDPNKTVFTPEIQDKLNQYHLKTMGYEQFKSGKLSQAEFGTRIAQQYRALPDPRTGRTYADQYASGNRATVSLTEFNIALKESKEKNSIPQISQTPSGKGGKIVEYLTGDRTHKRYRADHAAGNYHDHVAFDSQKTRDAAMAFLRGRGWTIGSINTGRHADGSYHYSNQAFDIPFYPNQSKKGVTDDAKGETKLSSSLRADLIAGGFSGPQLGGSSVISSPVAPTPSPAQITPTGTPQNPQMSQSLAPERTGPTVIVSQNPSSPAQQMMSSGGGDSSGGGSPQISEFALLNNFMRNKLLLDLAYL